MEDLIRRSDAIAILKDLQSKHLQFCLVPFRIAIEKVQAIPSAESTGDLDNAICEYVKEGLMANPYDRLQGEWIYTNNPLRLDDEWECSKCGYLSFTKANYCEHCGCRMKGADDE